MLLIGLAGLEVAERERAWLVAPGVAGVILFARNYADRAQLMALCESIREIGGEQLLIAVDQEGGPVQRFREGFTRLPALARIGEVHDRDPVEAVRLAEEHAWVMASELRGKRTPALGSTPGVSKRQVSAGLQWGILGFVVP